jgi:aconitate hydratase
MPATGGLDAIAAVLLRDGRQKAVALSLPGLTGQERDILMAGGLMRYYAAGH